MTLAAPEPDGGSAGLAPATGARRREVGAASARSLLLTVLGEFVAPAGEPVWTGTLVAAVGELGIEEKAARQALSRSAAEGLLEPERLGRRTRWHLSDGGSRLLADGRQRIYGFMREQPRWDGRWLVLLVTVPETQRQVRHRLRTQLTWAGLGSPSPGVWVVPDAGRAEEVAGIVAALGVTGQAFSWVGPLAAVGGQRELVRSSWSLNEVEQRYGAFVERYGLAEARTPQEAFRGQVRLVQEWRRFPFLDPALPPELLDHDWPGPEAARVFASRHASWDAPAQDYWRDLSTGRAA